MCRCDVATVMETSSGSDRVLRARWCNKITNDKWCKRVISQIRKPLFLFYWYLRLLQCWSTHTKTKIYAAWGLPLPQVNYHRLRVTVSFFSSSRLRHGKSVHSRDRKISLALLLIKNYFLMNVSLVIATISQSIWRRFVLNIRLKKLVLQLKV